MPAGKRWSGTLRPCPSRRAAVPTSPLPLPHLHLRPATAADCDNLAALVNAAYRQPLSARAWTTEADFVTGQRTDAHQLLRLIQTPGIQFLLCVEASRVVGSMQMTRVGDRLQLGMLAVDPQYQNRGLGRLLLLEAEPAARAQQCTTLELLVLQGRNALMAWYERRGWRRSSETRPFPYGQPELGEPRRSDLTLCVLTRTVSKET